MIPTFPYCIKKELSVISLFGFSYTCVCIHICAHTCACEGVCVCVHICAHICVCEGLFIYMLTYVHVKVCVHICAHMCL